MDITPHVNLLKSLRGERINYVLLVGEGIDNAFDAGANSINVVIDENAISFQDDGVGITRDRIASVFSLGGHVSMSTTQLGRFGVGIKNQAVSAGNIFKVVSASKDGRVKVSVDWRSILRTGTWTIDDPRWTPIVVGSPTGTMITIADLRFAKPPNGGWPSKIIADAAQRFYPAIAEGKRISLNGQQVELLPEPIMNDVIERNIQLSDDRSARLRAGILAEPSKLNRVHVAYRHRVIMPGSTLGCAEYGGLTKMFARVSLSGQWHLAKFKDELPDDKERDELEDAVADALRPILEKCNADSMSAKVDQITNLINELLPPELVTARPHRIKPPGPLGPSSERKKYKQRGLVDADKSNLSNGPAKSKRPRHQLLITFDGGYEQDGIGAFQPGRPHRVNLSKDDPYIGRLLAHRDQDVVVKSLYALAIAIFEQGRQDLDPELPFESFGKRIARLLAMQATDEATNLAS